MGAPSLPEIVDEIDLTDDVDHIEQVAEEILECIGLMGAPSLPEIVDEILEGISPLVRVDRQRLASNTRGDLVNLFVLKGFPQGVRNVEHDTLEEEDKGNPLIVGVYSLLPGLRTKSRVSSTCPRYTEGGHDPTVGVEQASRNSICSKAGDGRANEIIGSDEKAADEEESGRRSIVKLEER